MRDKVITLRLHHWHLKHLREHSTTGGFQNYHQRLLDKISRAAIDQETIVLMRFDEQEMGELVRMMGYGSGGFQSMLRKVFTGALLRQIGYD
jgi:hypothetical protein